MEGPLITSLLGWELAFFISMNLFWISLYYLFRKRKHMSPKLKDKPLVSVIVTVFNKAKWLRETINSVLNLTYSPKEIIVVNDGSTDGSDKICKSYVKKGRIKFIDFKKNFGKSHALNTGIKSAKGNLIMTVDADSVLEPDSLSKMIRHFTDKKIGAVAGTVETKKHPSLLGRLQLLEYLQQAFQRFIQSFWSAVLVLPGPISLYSKVAIAKAGYFESDTLVEDWDMTLKIHKAGYKIVSENRAKATTVTPNKIGEWWRQRIRWSRGGIQIARKHMHHIFRSKNKALARLIFPLHILWMIVPLIVFPTMILVLLPSQLTLEGLAVNFSLFFATLQELIAAGTRSMVELFAIMDKTIINFLDMSTMNWVRGAGYLSGLAFLTFTYTSVKVFKREFTPRHFLSVLFMPIYWVMLNAVFIYSLLLELFKSKMKW